jgi:CO dehydrogenase/acetyl-CoA synthase alpha subunit
MPKNWNLLRVSKRISFKEKNREQHKFLGDVPVLDVQRRWRGRPAAGTTTPGIIVLASSVHRGSTHSAIETVHGWPGLLMLALHAKHLLWRVRMHPHRARQP